MREQMRAQKMSDAGRDAPVPIMSGIYQNLNSWRRSLILLALACVSLSTGAVETLGLPKLTPPPADRVKLGQKLFFDARLSVNGTISCASCHQPGKAFSDGRSVAQGVHGSLGTRKTPSLLGAAYLTSLFWDGRRPNLETQALDPLVNPREHGLANHEVLVDTVKHDPDYLALFRQAFGLVPADIRPTHVGQALAAYERTLVAGNSPFDRYAYGHDRKALTPAAVRGLELFRGRANCIACHSIDAGSALFTDNRFHSLSVGMAELSKRLPTLTTAIARAREAGGSLDQLVLDTRDIANLGRFVHTLEPADIGKFRTPSLRNVALTAPYMHDGSVATLLEAVELEIYYRGAEAGRPLILTPREKDDLIAFLEALTSPNALTFADPRSTH
jgi:cytochrome c peroxidase